MSIKDILKEHTLCITFTKKDGTERTFERATRNMSVVPEDKLPNGTGVDADGVVKVFVEDIGEWRSFREENLVKYIVLQ